MAGLKKAAAYSLLGYAVWAACNFLNFNLVTRLDQSNSAGLLALMTAISTPATDLGLLSLRGVLNTDARSEFKYGVFMSLRLLGMLCASLACLVIAMVQYNQPGLLAAFGLLTARLTVESVSDILFGILQKNHRMPQVGLSMTFRGILGTSVFAAVFYQTRDLVPALIAHLVCSTIILAAYDLPNALKVVSLSDIKPEWDFTRMRQLLVLVLPLAANVALGSFITQMSRYGLNITDIAIYTAMYFFVLIGSTVVVAVSQSTSTALGEAVAAGNGPRFVFLTTRLLLLATAFGAAGIFAGQFFGQPLISTIFRPEYATQQQAFMIILLGGAFSYYNNVFGYALTAMRELKVQFPIKLVAFVVGLACLLTLVPRLGINGAAIAYAASSGIQTVLSAIVFLRASRQLSPEVAA